jgi:hypothetical protein
MYFIPLSFGEELGHMDPEKDEKILADLERYYPKKIISDLKIVIHS